MLSPNIRDCPLNNSLNPRCLRMLYGSVVSRRFSVLIRSNYFLYLMILLLIFLEKFWEVFFQLFFLILLIFFFIYCFYAFIAFIVLCSIDFKTHV